MRFKPYYYQQYCIDKIIKNPAIGIWLDMGMGKSVITLTAIDELINDYFSISKVLIIAPLMPARNVWPTELIKWDHLRNLTISLVLGNAEQRAAALSADADIYVINRENTEWIVERFKRQWPFDMVVIDELSSFKSSKAIRFRELRRVRKYINRIVGLTGTPAPNGLMDLWPQVYLLDTGKALGRTLGSYRDEYFTPDKRNGNIIYSWKPKDGAESQIYKRLDGLCISMKSADYLRLPERLDVTHKIVMPDTITELYRRLEKETILSYEDGDIDGTTAAVLANKLLQMAGGAVYTDAGTVRHIHDEKLNALDDLIESANGSPVVIFYAYKHERDRLLARYPHAVEIKAKDSVNSWNNGEIPILLAHPASAGHGLNLQQGGHIAIWFGLTYSLELYQQANRRLHRMGQTQTVLIHHLVMAGTIEETILDKVLTQKEERQNALIEALKAYICTMS